jgi:hypothetical protein
MVLMLLSGTRCWCPTVLILGLLAIASSCEREGDSQSMSSSQIAQRESCTLALESHVDAQNHLILRYLFHNYTGHDVYLFNRLYRMIEKGPVFNTDPNLVNIEDLPSGILVSKKIIAVPSDVDVEKPLIPCSSLVKSGASFIETIQLPLPLSIWTPYSGHLGQASGPSIVRKRAWFELGYFVSSTTSHLLAKSVRTKEGEAFYFNPFPIVNQKTIEIEIPMEIPVHNLRY